MRALALTLLILFAFSCEKESHEDENPGWLNEFIREIEDDPFYNLSSIVRWKYLGDYYYEVDNPVSSCLYCEIYDIEGNQVSWSFEELDSFLENRTDRKLIWQGHRLFDYAFREQKKYFSTEKSKIYLIYTCRDEKPSVFPACI